MTEATASIYKQLRHAQLELHAPKNETGRFGKSRSAEAILEAAKPALDNHGLTLVVSDEIVVIGERSYVKATATVYNDAGEHLEATAHAWEGDIDRGLDASQVTGKTSSYSRKYALGGLLAIDDTKDADMKAPEAPKRPTRPQAPAEQPDVPVLATRTQKARITALLRSKRILDEDMKGVLIEEYGLAANSDSWTKDDADGVIEALDGAA